MRDRPLRVPCPPPLVAILLELESSVVVRVIACSDIDEARLMVDLRRRDLRAELDAALAFIYDRIDRPEDEAA